MIMNPRKGCIMKGLAEVEFIIAVCVYITTIAFVTFFIIANIPLLHNTATTNLLKSKSYQYSELLLFDGGSPKNWHLNPQSADRVGFSSGRRYFLDSNKIAALSTLCLNYGSAVQKLALNEFDIVIEASYLDDAPVVGSSATICKPGVTTQLRPQFQTTRFGVLSDMSIVKIRVVIIG